MSATQDALNELKEANLVFEKALRKFNSVYEPNSVGIEEWIGQNEETIIELEQELDEEEE